MIQQQEILQKKLLFLHRQQFSTLQSNSKMEDGSILARRFRDGGRIFPILSDAAHAAHDYV